VQTNQGRKLLWSLQPFGRERTFVRMWCSLGCPFIASTRIDWILSGLSPSRMTAGDSGSEAGMTRSDSMTAWFLSLRSRMTVVDSGSVVRPFGVLRDLITNPNSGLKEI
jgi:hypothetical protein